MEKAIAKAVFTRKYYANFVLYIRWESKMGFLCDNKLMEIIDIPSAAKRLHVSVFRRSQSQNDLCVRIAENGRTYVDSQPVVFELRIYKLLLALRDAHRSTKFYVRIEWS